MNPSVPVFLHRLCFQLFGLIFLGVLASVLNAPAQTPAFPGALGFGQYASGGRGGTVYHVTTLADSGAGSFRDAVSHSGRIVVFDVGGYITLKTAVSCSGNLTIAGQTAPGGGIGFRGGEISFASRSNIICRFIRIRPGTETADPVNDDALSLFRARTVICDHCSFEFGPWNNIDAVSDDWQVWPVTDVTFQNCLDADPTGQQFGAHTESVSSRMSWFYSVFANSHNRNPLSKINDVFVNNVLYNCSSGYTTHTSTQFSHDIVNNYFIAGPAYSSSHDFPWFQVDNDQSIYYDGNLFDSNSDGALNGGITTPYWYQGASDGSTGTILTSPWSDITTNIPTYSPATAYRITASLVGALPRDQIDDFVITQVKKLGSGSVGPGAGTAGPNGSLYTSQAQTGLGNNGYGVINGSIAPIDSDGDGMPDYWEKAVGLNPNSSGDTMTVGADGYANIERFLNWLAEPHALTGTNTPVDVDLWQYTAGFTNASPVYAVTSLSNGVVTLNGHIAHFVPPGTFSGLGSFQFSVTANDGGSYTNNVGIVMSAIPTPQNLVWQGDGIANLWTNGGPANWNNGTNLVAFTSGDTVTFDDDGSNTPAINLGGGISAGTVYVLASSQDYTFGGSGFLSGGTSLFKTGNSKLTMNTANTFSGGMLINDGIVQIGDGITFNGGLAGPVTNNDTLIFATPGNLTSSASISGPGTLTKNGPGALTLSGTETYTGLTTVDAGSLTISGTLPPSNITNNGSLTFVPSGSQAYTNSLSGPGTVTLAGGTLTLSTPNTYTGNTTNRAGTLYIANSNAIGSGIMVYTNGNVWLTGGVTITNDFSISGASAIDLCLAATNGVCTWAGNVVNLQSAAQWRPGADTGGTLVFIGNAVMGTRNFIVPRGTVQFASNAVVSATGTATAFGRDTSGGNRSASVTIKDNAVITLGVCSLGGGQAGGGVTVTLQNNAVLSCGANNFDVQNVNRATAVTTLRLNGGTMTAGGFTKTKTSQTNVIAFNGGTLKAGTLNAAFLPAFNVSTNVVQSGGAIIDDGGFAITIAAPLIHDPGLGSTLDGGLTKLGAGSLTLSGVNTFNGPLRVNSGTLVLAVSGLVVAGATNIYLAAGTTMDVRPLSGFTLGTGRKLWGNGSVTGNFTVSNGALLAPGSNSIGTLTFSNSLVLAVASTNIFEINHSPLTNDSAMVSGTLYNGGALIVTNSGGAQLAAGDTFKLFNAGSYNGAFTSVSLPALPAWLIWNTNGLNTAGTISVELNATPVISSISVGTGSLGFSGTGGVGNAYYILFGATNLSDGNWTPLFTNQFDGSGNFNFTTNADTTMPQSFYKLELQ